MRRTIDRAKARRTVVKARRAGLTLREAAAKAGVHVATVCRWQAQDSKFWEALHDAEQEARRFVYSLRPRRRPRVGWRHDCPKCGALLEVRTAHTLRFWRCSRWPVCPFASWRPPVLLDCPLCEGPLFWSHSRKSVGCDRCKVRISVEEECE